MSENMDKPLVSIIMGSDSDLSVVRDAAKTLEEFGVGYEIKIISAHRNPAGLNQYLKSAVDNGVKIFIGAAGGAAHLPGVIAAQTTLPVIGIPVKAWSLDGMDSLLSIVQMPPGVPVASVGINGAKNAALLAIQMLALSDKNLQNKLSEFKQGWKELIEKKSEKLEKLGVEKYLEEKSKK